MGRSKHEPDIYHQAAQALHTVPAETLVFEDSLYALRTAKAAGYRTVGLYDADGEADQEGLQTAAEINLMTLQDFPAAWERLNRT